MKFLLFTPIAFAILAATSPTSTNQYGEPTTHTLHRRGIECGPGDGVWAPGDVYRNHVAEFCKGIEYADVSDGYMISDTYLIHLTPQSDGVAHAGKIIFAIENSGERPAYHIRDWMRDCANQLWELVREESGCRGDKGDTEGGTNTVGNIKFTANVKEGDTWPV